MMSDIPPRVWVENLGSAVKHSAIDEIPDLVIRVVDGDIWREFDSKMGVKTNATFEEFVTSPPLKGIGTTVETLRKLCTGNTVALDALDGAMQRPAHIHADVDNVNIRPDGNSSDQALRRLRSSRPDLHTEVLAGNLSAHAAMVDAGFRPKTVTVRLDDAERAAQTLNRNATPEFTEQLKELL